MKKIILWIIVLLCFIASASATYLSGITTFSYDFENNLWDDKRLHNATASTAVYNSSNKVVGDYGIKILGGYDITSGVVTGNGISQMTTGAWIKTTITGAEMMILAEYGASGSWALRITTANKVEYTAALSTGTCIALDSTASRVQDGAWHHVVASWKKGQNCRLYIDGSLINQSTSGNYNLRASSVTADIGQSEGVSDFSGHIDQAFFLTEYIDLTNVSLIYNSGVGKAWPWLNSPVINNNLTIPSIKNIFDSVKLQVNCSISNDGFIDYVRGNVTFQNGTTLNLGNNFTYSGNNIWNSSSYYISNLGWNNISFRCVDNNSQIISGFNNFNITNPDYKINQSNQTIAYETTNQYFGFEAAANVTEAHLYYDGVMYNATRQAIGLTYSNYTYNMTLPLIETNNTGKNLYWNYSIADYWFQTSTTKQNITWAHYVKLRNNTFYQTYTTGQEFTAKYNYTNITSIQKTHKFIVNQNNISSTLDTAISNTFQNYKATITTPHGSTFNLAAYLNVSHNGISYIRTSNTTINITPTKLTIYVKNEATGVIINNSNATFSSINNTFSIGTTSGTYYMEGLNVTEWTATFSSINYTSRTYIITTGNTTAQTLNVYLPINSTSETIFTIKDKDTSELLSDVMITMYRLISGTWQAVESKYSDVSGKAQFNYIPLVQYKFFLSRSNYTDYVFYLNPIIYSEYEVLMEKSTLINYSQDFDDIGIIYSPQSFTTDTATDFNFLIGSPTGLLSEYGYTLTYPGGTDTQTGTNTIGGQLTSTITITGAGPYDSVEMDYYYITTLSGRRNFTINFPIDFVNSSSNSTFMANKYQTYGLGIFERMIITTLIVVFVVGIATMVGQPLPGIGLGLFIFGYMVYIGFIPIWGILPSMFIGVFIIMWKSGG